MLRRYPGNLNMSFACVEGESLIMGLKVRGKGGGRGVAGAKQGVDLGDGEG